MNRKQEVRRYLRRTMEVKLLVRNTWISLVIYVLLGAVIFLNTRDWRISVLVPVLFAVPRLVWGVIRYARIMAKPESYCFYQTQLDMPHHSWWIKKRSYFTVALNEGDGTHTVVDTHAIFSDHGLFWPSMESCLNQTVTIAYNPDTKMVVVAG